MIDKRLPLWYILGRRRCTDTDEEGSAVEKKRISLSDGEWKLMNRLWERPPMTIMELTAALREETGWGKNTVITMLSRLEAKGAVQCEKLDRAKQYFPVLKKQDAARAETENFLGKVYGGSLGLMMSAMVESRRLTESDVAELSAILEKAGGAK
ncbi:MAG: BlaI/MecI/CopY family transcriptional regulator [Oscillibacter sp.]|nr:BlaI/MecI/CopY family transcriptional regulator [Oscillibacter sp.]